MILLKIGLFLRWRDNFGSLRLVRRHFHNNILFLVKFGVIFSRLGNDILRK